MIVLKDAEVRQILENLTLDDIKEYQNTLSRGLIEYYQDNSIIPSRIVTTTKYATHLFMGSSGSQVGMKALTGSHSGFRGLTTILDKHDGSPIGILNAATLTAFRTALSTTLALAKVFVPGDQKSFIGGNLIVYGSGPQAEWHLRLALTLYPGFFDKVVIINRTTKNADALVTILKAKFSGVLFEIVSMDDEIHITEAYKNTSVIFSCVPTSSPVVLKRNIDQDRRSRIFIGAIGSYKPEMIEIDGETLINQCISKGGKIIVDSINDCLREAGEFQQNNISKDSLIELGSLLIHPTPKKALDQLNYMKSQRVIICKLVGLCVMDIFVGSKVLTEAKRKGLGTTIDNF